MRRHDLLPTSCLTLAAVSWMPVGASRAADLAPVEGLPFEIGRLASSADATRPLRMFMSRAEIDRARKRISEDATARSILDRFLGEVDAQLDKQVEPIDESWWAEDRDKPWSETYPRVFDNTWIIPMRSARPAAQLAKAWHLTGQNRYLDKAIPFLMNLTSYSYAPEHYDVGMNYSIWGVEALTAYDLLFDKLEEDQRAKLDAMFTRLAWAVARNDVYWIENEIGGRINNHLAWHKAMLGLLGHFYGRDEMVAWCMEGPRGLKPLLADGLLDDGLWLESSLNYQFAAIAPMLMFADCQRRMGIKDSLADITVANGRTLKQSFDAMFNVLAPDGTIPTVGDCYGIRQRLYKISMYEWCWNLWGDEKYAWLVRQNVDQSVYTLYARPLAQAPAPPPIASLLRPEHGYAFLRSHTDAEYWGNPNARMAFLTYDRSSVHANADKLSLMLFDGRRMLLSDVEGRTTTQSHSFSSQIQGELNRGGLSQNTVMIDGQDQRCSPKMLDLVEWRVLEDERRVTAADFDGILYDGIRQMRTVAMTPDYVLDVFQVDCGDTIRQIDWIAHIMSEHAETPPGMNPWLEKSRPMTLPSEGPMRWLRDARSYPSEGPVEMEWREDESRLRMQMLGSDGTTVIACGYPATDEKEPPTIPMVFVRRNANSAVFAVVWLIGDDPPDLSFEAQPMHDESLVYVVTANGKQRVHLLPKL